MDAPPGWKDVLRQNRKTVVYGGLLFAAFTLGVKVAQSGPFRQSPRSQYQDYAAKVTKRFTDQLKGPWTEPAFEETPVLRAPEMGSNSGLVGPPPLAFPQCGDCGGDSRYCRHSARTAAIMNGALGVAHLSGTPVTTVFDRHMDYYFSSRR